MGFEPNGENGEEQEEEKRERRLLLNHLVNFGVLNTPVIRL